MIPAHYADMADRLGAILAHLHTSATYESLPMRRAAEWAVYQCMDAYLQSEGQEHNLDLRRSFRKRMKSVADVLIVEHENLQQVVKL